MVEVLLGEPEGVAVSVIVGVGLVVGESVALAGGESVMVRVTLGEAVTV